MHVYNVLYSYSIRVLKGSQAWVFRRTSQLLNFVISYGLFCWMPDRFNSNFLDFVTIVAFSALVLTNYILEKLLPSWRKNIIEMRGMIVASAVLTEKNLQLNLTNHKRSKISCCSVNKYCILWRMQHNSQPRLVNWWSLAVYSEIITFSW